MLTSSLLIDHIDHIDQTGRRLVDMMEQGQEMVSMGTPGADMTENERQIFDYLIKPDDMYNESGVYFHDLPWMQKIRFVLSSDAKESARELANIWAMTKKDPLSPIGYYMRNMVIPGAGLGLEG